MEETDNKWELLKRIEHEATGLHGKINKSDFSVPLDIVRNNLIEASKEINNHLKMANRLQKGAGETA